MSGRRETFTAEQVAAVEKALEPRLALVNPMLGGIAINALTKHSEIEKALEPLGLMVDWDPETRPGVTALFGGVQHAVHFLVDDEPERLSLRAMLCANVGDAEVCRWLRDAGPGESFTSGTGATTVRCVKGHPHHG